MTVAYKVKTLNPAEREAKIRAGIAASHEEQDFYDFRNQKTRLKVIRVEIDLPIYRMENFRTFIDQREYVARENKAASYFQNGQENESVQQIQHEILVKLAKTGRADSVTPVIDVLRKEKQREPLLITHRGVVVNGNRRLAAMRELWAEDGVAFAEFSHVNCMVLPEDATPEEIVDIEASLQAKPETRLDYDWIGDCQLINRLISLNRSVQQIAERLNRKKSEIQNSLRALAEAETYLKDWAKAPGEYSRVTDGEQFFKDLPGQLEGKPSQLEEASRVIGWTLYDHKEELGERLYAFNMTFGRRAADVLDRLSNELGVPLEGAGGGEQGEFEIEVEEDASISYDPVLDILKDPERQGDAADVLIDVCRGVVEAERDKKSGSAALRAVTVAHSKLSEVDLTRAAADTYGALDKQLEAVIGKASELRNNLAKYRAGAAGGQAKAGEPPSQ